MIAAPNETPGLWTHKTRPILFSLVVDDFGVKYVGKVKGARRPSRCAKATEFIHEDTASIPGQNIRVTYHSLALQPSAPFNQ
jgi:hypothetical protein